MFNAKWAACAVLVALALVGAASARASTSGITDSGGPIRFPSEAAAKGSWGISSFVFAPGTTTTFEFPSADGSTNTITASSKVVGKSFDSVRYQAEWIWKRVQLGDYKWTWEHYVEWAGLNSCSTTVYANSQWSNGHGLLWQYKGAGSYVYNTIYACVAYEGRQGHYAYCPVKLCLQDDWPWEVGHYYGWGGWDVYDYGR